MCIELTELIKMHGAKNYDWKQLDEWLVVPFTDRKGWEKNRYK